MTLSLLEKVDLRAWCAGGADRVEVTVGGSRVVAIVGRGRRKVAWGLGVSISALFGSLCRTGSLDTCFGIGGVTRGTVWS